MSDSTRRDVLAGLGVLGLASLASAAPAGALPGPARLPTGHAGDFDFLVGDWRGANRRLVKRFAGSQDWDEFVGELHCESRLDGIVSIDQANFKSKGWAGVTVRAFDLEQKRWYLYWINNKTGKLFPPVIGGFAGRHGEFYGDDTDDGVPVKVRFQWTVATADRVLWEQAFSRDGKTWETNWTCEHRRVK